MLTATQTTLYAGTYEDNRGSYYLFSAGGIDFIVVAMGWDPDDAEIEWMNQVLAGTRTAWAL